jgi:CxxC motif-containing protein
MGCRLTVDKESGGALTVTGNRCPRGAAYAQEEIRSPKRTVTATCAIADNSGGNAKIRRLPVKSAVPCPKAKIPALLKTIYQTSVTLPVQSGSKIISNWNNEGIDIIAVRTLRDV